MPKKIAVYGTYEAKVPVKQRYWKRRKDGVKQRYWKKTKRMKKEAKPGRFELHGTGKDLMHAVAKAYYFTPKRFVDVSATAFLEHPEKYGDEGIWIEMEVES